MALYVEVLCDVRNTGMDIRNHAICHTLSNSSENPWGSNPAAAKRKAKEAGWLIQSTNRAVCPGCRRLIKEDPDAR
jgi:hypothetical protein